eukprot:CAMPEP_0198497240 /NCGR_PEP_ID=MMETSP1462-20131121/6285_1 /TAXON_ID=1333877 /ORGANISM="Brandtodinium nutriculum, Strain RCC3387" /LENGTH=40 /DNA_ID= /DNA_START= /DNA_END= /DNA_ORIENTATION=
MKESAYQPRAQRSPLPQCSATGLADDAKADRGTSAMSKAA